MVGYDDVEASVGNQKAGRPKRWIFIYSFLIGPHQRSAFAVPPFRQKKKKKFPSDYHHAITSSKQVNHSRWELAIA